MPRDLFAEFGVEPALERDPVDLFDAFSVEPKEKASWTGVGSGLVESLPEIGKSTLGGIAQASGEMGLDSVDSAKSYIDRAARLEAGKGAGQRGLSDMGSMLEQMERDEKGTKQKYADKYARIDEKKQELKTRTDVGRAMFEDATRRLQAIRPDFVPGEDTGKEWVYDVGQAAARMTPVLLTGILTKNAALTTAAMGPGVYGESYGRARNEGRTVSEAHQDGIAQTAIELGTELPVFGQLFKYGKPALKKIIDTTVLEGLSEGVSSLLSTAYEAGVVDDEMTLGEAFTSAKTWNDAAWETSIGFGLGAVLGAGTIPSQLSSERKIIEQIKDSTANMEFTAMSDAALDRMISTGKDLSKAHGDKDLAQFVDVLETEKSSRQQDEQSPPAERPDSNRSVNPQDDISKFNKVPVSDLPTEPGGFSDLAPQTGLSTVGLPSADAGIASAAPGYQPKSLIRDFIGQTAVDIAEQQKTLQSIGQQNQEFINRVYGDQPFAGQETQGPSRVIPNVMPETPVTGMRRRGYDDPRLENPDYAQAVQRVATTDFEDGGGIGLVPDESTSYMGPEGRVIPGKKRTSSVHSAWAKGLLDSEGVSVKQVRKIAQKVADGKRLLGDRQKRVLKALLDRVDGIEEGREVDQDILAYEQSSEFDPFDPEYLTAIGAQDTYDLFYDEALSGDGATIAAKAAQVSKVIDPDQVEALIERLAIQEADTATILNQLEELKNEAQRGQEQEPGTRGAGLSQEGAATEAQEGLTDAQVTRTGSAVQAEEKESGTKPGLDLTAQTEKEIAEKETRAQDETIAAKEQADRELPGFGLQQQVDDTPTAKTGDMFGGQDGRTGQVKPESVEGTTDAGTDDAGGVGDVVRVRPGGELPGGRGGPAGKPVEGGGEVAPADGEGRGEGKLAEGQPKQEKKPDSAKEADKQGTLITDKPLPEPSAANKGPFFYLGLGMKGAYYTLRAKHWNDVFGTVGPRDNYVKNLGPNKEKAVAAALKIADEVYDIGAAAGGAAKGEIIPDRIMFGKYQGDSIHAIAFEDPEYIAWVAGNKGLLAKQSKAFQAEFAKVIKEGKVAEIFKQREEQAAKEAEREKERKAKKAVVAKQNQWLADILDDADRKSEYGSGFAYDMARKLEEGFEKGDFSPRQWSAIRKAYAKHVTGRARVNSKKYKEAVAEFDAKTEPKETVEVTLNGQTDTVAKSPSKEQIAANVYKKGHYSINGLSTTVETAAGERRKPEWPPLKDSYGDIKRTIGAEGVVGEGVDVFYNNEATDAQIESRVPFVIDQYKKDGSFDEHKAVFGAKGKLDAKRVYKRNYSKGWTGGKAVTEFTWDEFKEWSSDPENTKVPAADWKKDKPVKTEQKARPTPKVTPSKNTVFTDEAAEAALALLKSKLGQLSSGIDPEIMQAGITLAGHTIEKGARTFTAYSKAMADMLGDVVKPYLRSWYEGVRHYPGMEDIAKEMTPADKIKSANIKVEEPQTDDDSKTGKSDLGEKPVAPEARPELDTKQGQDREPVGDLEGKQSENLPEDEPGKQPQDSGDRAGEPGGRRGTDADQVRDESDGREGVGGTGVVDAEPGGRGTEQRNGNPLAHNFHIEDPLEIVGGGQVARFNKNKAAIQLFHELNADGRIAAPEEQQIIAGYTGWGSFGQELFQGNWQYPNPKKGWEARDEWLREELGQDEWKSAQRSITNAHYTDPPTVLSMWSMLERLGFEGGRVLEPAMGIGNFFGMMPKEMKDRSTLTGIELDELTGGMAKQLYPNANISIKAYQDSRTQDDFYDLVIGNWPFENTAIADRRYNKINPFLHDYFFLKALDQVRPGGFVVGITSKGTMDKVNKKIRLAMAKKAELVGAFRLPSGAFKEYAGTSVVTDIIVLQKRDAPKGLIADESWVEIDKYKTRSGEEVNLNKYYHENPDHVLGTISYGHGTTTGRPGMIVDRPKDMQQALDSAVSMLPEGVYKESDEADHVKYITNHTDDRQGSLVEKDGKFYVVRGEHLAEAETVKPYALKDEKKTEKRKQELRKLIDLRAKYAELIQAERSSTADQANEKRKILKNAYQSFTKAHGALNKSFGLGYLRRIGDPFFPSLASLESNRGTTQKPHYVPATILDRATTRSAMDIENPSISESYVIARNNKVSPTLKDIAKIAKKPEDEVRKELIASGAAFPTIDNDIIPSDIYLSGNVREKLYEAKIAVEDGYEHIKGNVTALEKVVPKDIPYHEIEARMGASWIDTGIYQDYMAHMLNLSAPQRDAVDVTYVAGKWKVRLPAGVGNKPEARSGYGTPYAHFGRIVNAAISNQTVTIKYKDDKGNTHVDEEGTKEANERVSKIRNDFSEWVWKTPERRIALEKEYNEARNAWASPEYDGSFLEFEGMALQRGDDQFNLRKHQADAIWRAIVNRKSLNAHEVGTGKTYTIAGIAIESRRYGIAKKPLLLAHNANSATVAAEVLEMYPSANILYIDNLSHDTIDVKLRQIQSEDWDLIVMPHSLIDRLTLTEETMMAIAQEEIAALEQEAREAADDDGVDFSDDMLTDEDELKKLRSSTAKELVKARNRIIAKIQRDGQRASKEGAVPFEELGVDMVLVDEVHEFKKPPIVTKMNMKGLNTDVSSKSIALQFLTRYTRAQNNGGNVHTFTGTPITNTLTEIYHQMRYIMEEEMEAADVSYWDGWMGSFASEETEVELTAAGEYEAVTRLSSFINVPELRKMVGQYMDVVFSDSMPEMKPRQTKSGKVLSDKTLTDSERMELENGRTEGAADRPYKKIIVDTADMTPVQEDAFRMLQGYAKDWRNMDGKARRQAMLSGDPRSPIITEGLATKASFDARLLQPSKYVGQEGKSEDHPESKASRVVRNVTEVYNSHEKSTQAIFMQIGINKKTGKQDTISIAGDIIERLVQSGIPREEIAMVTGTTSKKRRKAIAEAMNRADIRVVIGSTATLGVGVNMQRNLRAMHHVDAPWMPGDLEQRNGRGHRQGNQWNTVLEYRYLTDRLDGRRWQILSIKQRFIESFLKAQNESERTIEGDAANEEESDILSTFSEAAGDPRILIKEKLKKKIEQLQSRERMHTYAVSDAKREAKSLRDQIKGLKAEAEKFARLSLLLDEKLESIQGDKFSAKIGGKQYTTRKKASDAIKKYVVKNIGVGDKNVRIGEIAGLGVFAEWSRLAETPNLYIDYGMEGFKDYSTSLSVQGILTQARNRIGAEDVTRQRISTLEGSAARMEEISKEPFKQADKLKKNQDDLRDLEADLSLNPVPPPAWLRQGAPVGTDVVWDNSQPNLEDYELVEGVGWAVPAKEADEDAILAEGYGWVIPRKAKDMDESDVFLVKGHRYTDKGWFVVAENDKRTVLIPYDEAKDKQGYAIYEEREFTGPDVITKPASTSFSETTRTGKSIGVAAVEKTIAPIQLKWMSGPNVRVVQSVSNLPDHIAKAAEGKTVDGVYDGGTVYLVADNIISQKQAQMVLAHEAVGHFSMEEMLGDEFGDILKRVQMLKKLGSKRVKEIAQEVADRYDGLTEAEEASEIIAVMAEKGIKNSLMKRVYAAVRRFLRSIGFSVMFTQTELEALVAKAASRMGQRRAAQQGQAAGSEAFSQRDARKQSLAWLKTSTVEGKPAFKSDDITLVPVNEVDTGEGSIGDVMYDEVENGFSDHGLMGHASKVRPGERVIQYTLHDGDRAIGSLHTGVMDGKISSIHDIYIEDQGEGLGENVVATIAANSDDVLIADITPDAQAFWEKMGVDYVNVNQDATLNWEGYKQARAATEGQRAGDERADEQGATGVSEGLSQEAKDFFERELGGPKFSRRGRDDRASDELKEKLGLSKKNTSLMQFVRDVRNTDWGETKRHHEDEWTQGALDRFYGIKRTEDEYAGRIDASQSGYVAARLSTGLSSIVTATLHYGTPQWKEGILQKIPDSKGLLEIFEPVGDEINDWLAWIAGKRADRLMAEGREHNLTDEDIQEALALNDGREDRFQAVADEYAKFMSRILDVAEQAGLIDSNSRKMWEHADYVPFYRMTVDSMFKKGPKGRKGMSHQSSGIRRLRGSELATNDLLENIVMNVTHLLDASVKNNALGKTLRNLKGTGVYEDATMEFKKELIPMSQVKQQIKRNLKNMGMDKMQIDEYMDTLPPEVIEGMQKLWAIKAPSDPDVVRVMVQGKARYYRVNDPLLVRALTQVNAEKTHTVPMEIARSFKRILTATVTSTPEFMLRNFIRDAAHAWTISDDSFTPLVDSVRGAGKTLKLWSKDVDHAAAGGAVDMMFAGGSFLGGYIHGNDPTQTATAIRAALRKRGYSAASADEFMSTIIDTPAKYWERYREIGDAIENASREAVYEAAMKAGKSKAQAIFEAKDLMDYSMQGQWGLFQGMGDVIPFFNARLQGLYKLKRAGAIPGWASKAKVLARGGIITGMSLALLALNWDDDRYEALEDWDKDAYWHFFIGDHHFRIPKPFEVGVIYGTIPERMARHFGGKDDTKKAMKQLLWNFRETLNLVQMPQIVKPIAEIWANKDTFTERPIENMADEGKLKSAMYNEHTSATMRKLGEAFSDDIGLSPKQLQHLWRGYLGSLGMYALGVTDMATRWATDAPTRPELRPEDIPVLKSFYRGEGPARSTRYKTELYEMLRDVDKIYRTIRSYGMQGREEDAQELLEKNKGKLAIRQGLSAGSMGLKQIRMNIDMIMRDTEKTKKEKRQEIDELMETANQMTKKIVEATYPIYSAN